MSLPDILRRIAERRREATVGSRVDPAELPEGAPRTPRDNRFLAALAAAGPRRGVPAIIAEVKMGSPRLGRLADRANPIAPPAPHIPHAPLVALDPVAQATLYATQGAAALSVVVEPDFFFGSYELLTSCQGASGLPAIAKDFVVDPVQLVWARQAGAEAVLLIAALLEAEEMARYARIARGLGLVPLVEIHSAEDVAKLGAEPWELVGVNNRDLRTFDVDLQRSINLLPFLPAEAVKVAESGIRDGLDVALLRESGFDAFLIGESLLLAPDPAEALRQLLIGPEI